MRIILQVSLCLILLCPLYSQSKALSYYLPDIEYNPQIPTPEEVLGYQIGDWHVSHDQLYMYMKILSDKSDRIVLEEYARSHENRPLIVLKITNPGNHQNLEDIRQNHIETTNSESPLDVNSQPIVIYQGYSIHGNESSGSNAALLVAYYLAAGKSQSVNDLLNNSVILLDPCYNPDGLQRFSTWVNMHKNKNMTSDPASREYNEVWPRGRTNHYWFDLNRDWLLLTHPESQGRITMFHKWKPNILTDHHEMGTNSTFFFQPGIPSRTNPNTPAKNQELTGKIAEFHAKALDEIGSLYYAKENFDDFYYGKGSTYPDVNGCLGILFEQASSRGHLQESDNGVLSFPFTIRNQVTTSLSTQEAGLKLRKEILKYQRDFFKNAKKKAENHTVKAYIFGEPEDPYRLKRFVNILLKHDIDVFRLNGNKTYGNMVFNGETSFVVPMDQQQFTLCKTIFEEVTDFKDSLFYDVSAWTMPLAFDINFKGLSSKQFSRGMLGKKMDFHSNSLQNDPVEQASYGYLIDWADYLAPKALYKLLDKGIKVKVLKKEFVQKINGTNKKFHAGTLIVPLGIQLKGADEVFSIIKSLENLGLDIHAISTGMPVDGIFMGSPNSKKLEKPKILLMVGNRVNSYEAGAAWHQLDQIFDIPISSVDISRINSTDLRRYNTIILANGSYNAIAEKEVNKLTSWVEQGGNLILMRNALNWATQNKLVNLKRRSNKQKKNFNDKSYDASSRNSGSLVIGGSIFEARMDLSHPLCYGYRDKQIFFFKRDTNFFEKSKNQYATPIQYIKSPLRSGYMDKSHNNTISNAAAVIVYGKGSGTIICLVDNPNFRGYWWGTSKLFANAIFMSSMIKGSTKQK